MSLIKSLTALKFNLEFNISAQPDDTTCGPTCLQSLYKYYGDEVSLHNVIQEVPALENGGTLAVLLANHALQRGYEATIYTYNLQMFDPTWFFGKVDIKDKLRKQMEYKEDLKFKFASQAYIEFLELGGRLRYKDLSKSLITRYLKMSVPILTGLSSTYLYNHVREFGPNADYDDLRGEPAGHFVVLSGYDKKKNRVLISDPLMDNPYSPHQQYTVKTETLICAILLGIITYDANLLIIKPKITF